jgi:formiminoglutamase
MTLSGFSGTTSSIHLLCKNKNILLHICEGAPDLGEEKNNHLIGKLIGYLVTDFMKSNSI